MGAPSLSFCAAGSYLMCLAPPHRHINARLESARKLRENLYLAQFGILIWPTLGVEGFEQGF